MDPVTKALLNRQHRMRDAFTKSPKHAAWLDYIETNYTEKQQELHTKQEHERIYTVFEDQYDP